MVFGEKEYKLTLLGGEEFVFSTLSAAAADQAYSTIKLNNDNPEYTEYLFNMLTGNRYKGQELQAGIPILVIFLCLKTSGIIKTVKDLPDIYEEARDGIQNNIFYSLYAEIIKAFHTYKLEELKKKTTKELFELVALSEKITGNDIFDLDKMRKSLSGDAPTAPKQKGVASVTKDELDLINSILANEEERSGGMPSIGAY